MIADEAYYPQSILGRIVEYQAGIDQFINRHGRYPDYGSPDDMQLVAQYEIEIWKSITEMTPMNEKFLE